MRAFKIVRIAEVAYPSAARQLYERVPNLTMAPYAVQKAELAKEAVMYSDAFSRGMRALGHEADEIVFDLEPLQAAWAREQGIAFSRESWKLDTLMVQIERARPEILFLQDMYGIPHELRKRIRERFPFIRGVVMHKGYPGAFSALTDLDLLLVALPNLVKPYQDAGLRNVRLLYHAFDEGVLNDAIPVDRRVDSDYDFTFLGSSGFGRDDSHYCRFESLVELMDKTCLHAWVEESAPPKKNVFFKCKEWIRFAMQNILATAKPDFLRWLEHLSWMPVKAQRLIRGTLDASILFNPRVQRRIIPTPLAVLFPSKCSPPLYGRPMYRILGRSRVTYNRHTDNVGGFVGNIRLFQATGMGACLLTDRGTNLRDLFSADNEVAVYSSMEECLKKLSYLLRNERERARIAAAGQKRTLRDHTMKARCEQIDEYLRALIKSL